ncbi:YheC/YheD family protein [Aquibacillus sediminis]|uniref:YheC/YheD family endospore coat-associated protein n=1 Tax=Aquibacillus sediminis TaxID=2574734 RepID=UPI001109CEC9|nr:YheC/YheD family protein [Aquibacillus sediminis]
MFRRGQLIIAYTFDIKFYQGNKNRMIVPSTYYNQFHGIHYIQYGPYQTNVECLGHHKDQHTLYLSSQLKTKLNISNNKQITIRIDQQTCVLLLTLGVYIAGFGINSYPLGPRTTLFETMSQAGKKLGFQTIFFGHQHVNRAEQKVNAFYLQDDQWQQGEFDYPNVVYNRLPNRKVEHHPHIVTVKKQLQQATVLFNSSFFNKWEVHERLIKSSETSYLLPETILHPSRQTIKKLVSEGAVYIKPIHGSRGEGIVKCKQLETNEVESHYYHKDKPKINRYTEIDAFLEQQFPNGQRGYIAQKEIPLLKKGSSAIDFRVHANKNHRNSWEVSLICAKFAGKGSLTTHVQRGGSLHTLEELFSKEHAKRITNKLTTTTLTVCETMEKHFSEPVGEIGFDFGIDEEGKVWLFEANSKPGYSVFDHPKLSEKAPDVFSYLFKYAFYLHNYKMNSKEL